MVHALVAVLVYLLIPANEARAQSSREMAYNTGANYGRAQAFIDRCNRYQFDGVLRRKAEAVRRRNRSAFEAGEQSGKREVAHLDLRDQDPEMRKATACLNATLAFGPYGKMVPGLLVDNQDVLRAEKAADEAKRAAKIAAAEARTDVPAPGASEFDLIVEPGENPDKLTGRHKLRVKKLSGMTVGCVPCFNSMTYIVIADGVPYAANGGTIPRLGRYRVVIDGVAKPVRHINSRPGLDAIEAIRAIPGCDFVGPNYLDRLVKAVTQGQCLGN